MSAIKLNLINHSNDQNNSDILIFQKNVTSNIDEMAIAWQVIKNLAHGWHHSFEYPSSFAITAIDPDGNESPFCNAEEGQGFNVIQTPQGHELRNDDSAASPHQISINNSLLTGPVEARIYKGGKLLANWPKLYPMQRVAFEFKPAIFIGVVSQMEEGSVVESAILPDITTEISLLGIKSADIIWSGGGSGADAEPFTFHLENVQMQ